MLLLVLLVVAIVLLLGGLPVAPWGSWHALGWTPSGVGAVLLVVLLVLLLIRMV